MYVTECCLAGLQIYGDRLFRMLESSDFVNCPKCGNLSGVKLKGKSFPAKNRKKRNRKYFIPYLRRQLVFARDGWRCVFCKKQASSFESYYVGNSTPRRLLVYPLDEYGKKFTIDHLVPRAKDGSGDINNLVTSCEQCNARKADNFLHVDIPRITLL